MLNEDNYLTKENSPIIEQILKLDRQVMRLVRAGWPDAWLHINLPLGATRALLVIEAGRARTPREVAQVLGVGRTTVTGLLDKLETEELLTRSIDRADKRSFVLELTPKGRALVEEIEGIRRHQIEQALEHMQPAAREALFTGLEALVTSLQQGLETTAPKTDENKILSEAVN